MGLNWYIEIIISLFYDISYDGWISFCIDMVSMLQGFWVLANLTCQRNIKDILYKAMSLMTRSTYMT